MAKKEKHGKYSMKQDVYRQAIIEELAMAYSLQTSADSLAGLGFGFSGDIGQVLIERAMRKLVKISRYGSRRAKVYCARNMARLDPRAALHLCKKRLHVGDLCDSDIEFLKICHGIITRNEEALVIARQNTAKVLTTFPHYTIAKSKKESK